MPAVRRVSPPVQAALAGGGWAAVVLVLLVVVYGGPGHVAFANPDEATSQHAIQQVIEHGRPVEVEPFDDPNDLTHQHLWVTPDGTTFVPAYPMTLPLVVGWSARLLPLGRWLLFAMPAAGLGGLVAAVALTLPRHRWAAALLPGVAFPGAYWFLRPWHNISAFLSALGVAALLWALWARSRRWWWGAASLAATALAAALRPDQIHVAVGLSLLAFVAVARGREAWRWVAGHAAAGVAAAVFVAYGNVITTGAWLTTAVDLLDLPESVEPWASTLPTPANHVMRIVGQNGLPSPDLLLTQGAKYWAALGPVWALTVLALAAVGWLVWRAARRGDRRTAWVTAGAALLLAWLFVGRLSPTDSGAGLPFPELTHSLPRYSAASFLGAGVAAVAGAVLVPSRALRGVALAGTAAVAVAGAAFVWDAPAEGEEDLVFLDAHYEDVGTLPWRVAAGTRDPAVVYSFSLDKYLWAGVPVGRIQHEGLHRVAGRPTVEYVNVDELPVTLAHAVGAGYHPYVFEVPAGERGAFEAALDAQGLALEPVVVAGLGGWQVVPRG